MTGTDLRAQALAMRRVGDNRIKIFFDGGCRPNPGFMETAVVAAGKLHHHAALGQGTSHDAEWLALLQALRVARMLGRSDCLLVGDSKAVIGQANRSIPCRISRHRDFLLQYEAMAATFPRLRLRHIARTQNLAGIALARLHPR